jgi:hypothetical protein
VDFDEDGEPAVRTVNLSIWKDEEDPPTRRPHVLTLAAGPHFDAVIGVLDREVYAEAGRSGHLFLS